jgi:hypothetical protein
VRNSGERELDLEGRAIKRFEDDARHVTEFNRIYCDEAGSL